MDDHAGESSLHPGFGWQPIPHALRQWVLERAPAGPKTECFPAVPEGHGQRTGPDALAQNCASLAEPSPFSSSGTRFEPQKLYESRMSSEQAPALDVRERGAPRDGVPQSMDRRLFMQLLVFECPAEELKAKDAVVLMGQALEQSEMGAVIYEDVNHPSGIALLSYTEDPADFVKRLRPALARPELAPLKLRSPLTMFGRSYSSGFEPDLEFWLLRRPAETVHNPDWPWAIWYPLRRGGAFEQLERKEKSSILREHAVIGKRYGEADLAHDVRLACHGLDENDNEFVVGLIGKELYPLSHVVQAMRSTRQTSQYITQMGPFFVGYRAWSSRVG